MPATTLVVITMDRREELLANLPRLLALPEQPPVVVVDNASRDGTAVAVREAFPEVTVIALDRNLGAAGRNVGVEAADTELVAFADDDSWWEPGALARAAEHFAAHPRLGLLTGRVLVHGRDDPINAALADSPLPPDPTLPGPPVLGFLACAAVVRRDAFLEAGGFEGRYVVGGEEELLALDLVSAGWGVAYADDVLVHHAPSPGPRPARRVRQVRNDLWTTWLRRRGTGVVTGTVRTLRRSGFDPATVRGAIAAMGGLPWVLRDRRPVPAEVEAARRRL